MSRSAAPITWWRCGLHSTRTQIVFGDGDPNADLLFVGEGPGEQEVDELITEVRCEHFDLHSGSAGAADPTGTRKKLEAS